jgi:hypothetical protein
MIREGESATTASDLTVVAVTPDSLALRRGDGNVRTMRRCPA